MSYEEKLTAFAVLYVERYGFSVLPMSEDKKPTIKWKEFQDRKPTIKEILEWPKENLAIITGAISNIVVVDCESHEDAKWFYTKMGKSPVIVQTKRGFHFYFRHPGQQVMNGQRIHGRYDIRGDGGYVLAPPSRHSLGSYRFVKPLTTIDALPVFNPDWRPSAVKDTRDSKAITDGRAYIAEIKAVSGAGGHNDTYRACCVLRSAGLSEAEALFEMQQWNRTNANPPWSDREILHKVQDAFR